MIKKGRPPVVSGGREEGCFDGQRVLSKEKEEVFFGGGRAAPEGAGTARKFVLSLRIC